MTARPPTIPEPLEIEIAKFWKTRWRNESVRVSLSEFEGHRLVNVRIFRTDAAGIDFPTSKGVTMGINKLPELTRALEKALTKARELGLIPNEEGGA